MTEAHVDNLSDYAIGLALKGEPIGFPEHMRNTTRTFQAVEQLMEAGLWESRGMRAIPGLGRVWMYGPKDTNSTKERP